MSTEMGVFEEQLRERQKLDQKNLSRTFIDVADSLRGKSRYHAGEKSSENLKHEVEAICQYYHVEIPSDYPDTDDVNDIIDYITQPSGVMHRRVMLEDKWWKNGDGALLAVKKDSGAFTAVLPRKVQGYTFYDDNAGVNVKVTEKNKDQFEREALCFYQPLPSREMDKKQLLFFILKNISPFEYLNILLATLAFTLVGMLTPLVTSIVFYHVIPTGKLEMVASSAFLLLSAAAAAYMMSVVRTGLLERVKIRMETLLQNALMGRVIHLPPKFFKGKSAGGLSESVVSMRLLPQIITDSILGPGIIAVFSLGYVAQIYILAPGIALPALVTLLAQALIIVLATKQKMRLMKEELAATMETQGIAYTVITGIQRIKLSGSEKRVMSRWGQAYKNKSKAAYNVYFPSTMQNELVMAAALIGTLWVYFSGAQSGINVAQFAAFLSAFTIATTNLTTLSQSGQLLPYFLPLLEMIEPVLRAVPESNAGKTAVGRLNGAVEMSHVTFRYSKDSPLILDDVSLKINPGEYVAVVGRSGCGKSTFMRVLMGFEKPENGAVTYDNMNLEDLDPASLRRNIGTVLQEGQLFVGDIFANITVSAPWLTLKEAWEAAEMADVADDIRDMPMGMNTVISEGGGGISGGQRQRLMIARAIAPKPKILMLDEATSALDNITQKKVSDSLEKLNCTRIVIAHRLSTIRNCDRILVLDKGKIIEDGNYDELVKLNGVFADLVARQRV